MDMADYFAGRGWNRARRPRGLRGTGQARAGQGPGLALRRVQRDAQGFRRVPEELHVVGKG
ncbi:hypothetical protein SSAG_00087 [Streptomyces sp. Mg1]|nr:hypothetical protein SSAG_00087 [Streptomyces sp. Mg1]